MPAKQLDTLCWKPCAPGEDINGEGPHWGTRERAAEYADPGDVVLPFPAPCWTATCDGWSGGQCGEELEDPDEGWTVHAENPADLACEAARAGWETDSDGTMQCPVCIDADLTASEPA